MRGRWQCETTRRQDMGWQGLESPSWTWCLVAPSISTRRRLGLRILQCGLAPVLGLAHERVLPKLASHFERVDPGRLPPCELVYGTMSCTVMDTTKGDHELIACLTAKRAGLREAQVMRIGWLACAE